MAVVICDILSSLGENEQVLYYLWKQIYEKNEISRPGFRSRILQFAVQTRAISTKVRRNVNDAIMYKSARYFCWQTTKGSTTRSIRMFIPVQLSRNNQFSCGLYSAHLHATEPFAAKGLVRRDGLRTLRCEGSSNEKVNVNNHSESSFCWITEHVGHLFLAV